MSKVKVVDIEELSVEWPDREGWNCVLRFTDLAGNSVEVALPTSATDDLRKALGPSPLRG